MSKGKGGIPKVGVFLSIGMSGRRPNIWFWIVLPGTLEMWANSFSHVVGYRRNCSYIRNITCILSTTFIEHLQDAGIILSTLRVIRMHLFIIHSFTNSHILNTYCLSDTMLNAWDIEMKHSPSLQKSMGSNHFLNSYHVPNSSQELYVCDLYNTHNLELNL